MQLPKLKRYGWGLFPENEELAVLDFPDGSKHFYLFDINYFLDEVANRCNEFDTLKKQIETENRRHMDEELRLLRRIEKLISDANKS